MAEVLNHRFYQPGRQGNTTVPLVILHGLFGSSKNWHSISQALSESAPVYALDLRNHGESFHAPTHTMPELAEDVRAWLQANNIEQATLVGHSMGGLAAMILAVTHGHLLKNLVVVDIAPRPYDLDYSNEFAALNIDLSDKQSRPEIDQAMQQYIVDKGLRQFLQTNIERSESGYQWRLNVPALEKARLGQKLSYDFEQRVFEKPTLFIRGGASQFMSKGDETLIQKIFTGARFATIEDAGHWLHHTHQQQFLSALKSFLF